jgi:hypothetical protein
MIPPDSCNWKNVIKGIGVDELSGGREGMEAGLVLKGNTLFRRPRG